MRILGISAFHRASAAALVVDGKPIACIEEDRFTKRLQDEAFPTRAARACLALGDLQMRDLDGIVFYEKPLRKFERVMATQLGAFPKSAKSFSRNMFSWLGDRLWMKNRIADELEFSDTERIYFTEHQLAHAAAAYYASPFEDAAVLVLDDSGEWATSSLASGVGSELTSISEIHFPHSLGLVVSAIAQYLGLEPGVQDHLLEGLAANGTPRYLEVFEQLVPAGPDGSFTVDMEAFRYNFDHETLYSEKLEALLGPARLATSPLRFESADSRDADVAASLQALIEMRSLALCTQLHEQTGNSNLCFGGRLAGNRTLCARLLADGPFDSMYVPPECDDAGAALGAALFVDFANSPQARRTPMNSAWLGMQIEERPEEGAQELSDPGATLVDKLVAGERVAWVRGAFELGTRSQGHRSLLSDPRPEGSRVALQETVQIAEPFLPIRLLVPEERAQEFFVLPEGADLALEMSQITVPAKEALKAIAPSAISPQGTAWPQVVRAQTDPAMHRLLTEFGEKSGVPLLLHETFALRGAPIVRMEADAFEAFQRTSLDSLIVENRLYERAKD
jgi:carbamoyltransferase